MAIEKLIRLKSPGIDEIPAKLITAGGRTIRSDVHELINSIWNKEELPEEWKELFIVPFYLKGNINIVIIEAYQFFQPHTKLYTTSRCHG
jgi:hypothetical protein